MLSKRPLWTLLVALATAKHAQTAAARRRPKPQHVYCTGRTRAGPVTTKQSDRKGAKAARWGSWRGGARGRGWHATKPNSWVDLTPRDLFHRWDRPLGRSLKPSNRPQSHSWTRVKLQPPSLCPAQTRQQAPQDEHAPHSEFSDRYRARQARAEPVLIYYRAAANAAVWWDGRGVEPRQVLYGKREATKQTRFEAQVHHQIDPPHPHLRDTDPISSAPRNTILGASALHRD